MDQQRLNEIFAARADDLAEGLVETWRLIPRFAEDLDKGVTSHEEFLDQEVRCIVDYLREWLVGGNDTFRSLYIAERSKAAFDASHDARARNAAIKHLVESDRRIFKAVLSDLSDDEVLPAMAKLDGVVTMLDQPVRKELRILLVGDCLFLDIMGFLTGLAAVHGTALAPDFITEKNPAQVLAQIAKKKEINYDLVFFSPFTYEFNQSFAEILQWKNVARIAANRSGHLKKILEPAEAVSSALAASFAAPLFIHNTAAVIRAETAENVKLKSRLTAPLRSWFRRKIDAWVDRQMDHLNGATFPHVFKLDELKYRQDFSDEALGQYFYWSPLQHPARLGALIAEDYDEICEAIGCLYKKKLVVCDLDNTLWEGVIGEGAVAHCHDRQSTLLSLRKKGVLLSIASKNDPANVHFDGGTLGDDDFVYRYISWNPKIAAFPAMQDHLNLKMKDFVFIDDRPDERAFVSETYPEIVAYDPTAPRTWRLFSLWERLLDDNPEMDRTQMYHEREKRAAFAATLEAPDERAMFAALDLRLTIREVGKEDVARATELINRTNQFNMQGSRTNFAQMSDWQASTTHKIFVASMADKFGDMGIISVMVADYSGDYVEIPIFVLSCRVFGYGAETALLNAIKRSLDEVDKKGIRGVWMATPANAPCKETYPDNGFVEVDGAWVYEQTGAAIEDPEWLTITLR
ncbi:MAG: HAD-IIIC family phosphatase [Parvularcula sp.]